MALIEHINELSEGAKTIAQFEVGEAHKNLLWQKMVEFAEPHGDKVSVFREKENEILTLQSRLGKSVFNQKGAPVMSRMFDTKAAYSTYRSTKSTILKATALGIALKNPDGSIKGKTAVAKEIKACALDGPKSQWEVAVDLTLKLSKVLNNLSNEQKKDIHTYLFGNPYETKT